MLRAAGALRSCLMKWFQCVAGVLLLGAFAACETLPVAPIVEDGDYPDASSKDTGADAPADAPAESSADATSNSDAAPDGPAAADAGLDAAAVDADAGVFDAAFDVADADAGD